MDNMLSTDDADDLHIVANTLVAVVQRLDEFPAKPSRLALRDRCVNVLVMLHRRGITPQPDQVDAAYAELVADETPACSYNAA